MKARALDIRQLPSPEAHAKNTQMMSEARSSLLKKQNLSMAGEYATASEVCRRDKYAQVTLGNLKRTDILVYSEETRREAQLEVKSKQAKFWPWLKGIHLVIRGG